MPKVLSPTSRRTVKNSAVDPDEQKVRGILSAHQNFDFVRRILTPDKYPSIPAEGGKRATHKMMWGEADGKFLVFPSIIHNNGVLKDLSAQGKAAMDHAFKSGEYIPFSTKEEADWFSKNYKKVWPKQSR